MIGQFQDYVAIRYADVLLMAAELGSTNAQKYFDDVRSRAGLPSIPLTTEALREERRFEFVGEGIRFYDLLRYDYTLDYAANKIAITKTVKSGGNDETVTINGDRLKATKGLQQIPQNQITLSNGVLDQNDGWKIE